MSSSGTTKRRTLSFNLTPKELVFFSEMRSIYFLANVILLISTTFAFQSRLIQFKAVVSTSKPLQLKCAANHRCSRMMKFPGHSNIRCKSFKFENIYFYNAGF